MREQNGSDVALSHLFQCVIMLFPEFKYSNLLDFVENYGTRLLNYVCHQLPVKFLLKHYA